MPLGFLSFFFLHKKNKINCVSFLFVIHRALARKLTYALAASFQEYSKRVKEIEQQELKNDSQAAATKKKFAIDLRTPEEMQQTIEDQETEA